ncbi:hypothetical protein BT69DRAFT_1276971 [Atractiella rhizophila]|nr:hypothetical protein BT69DRAFT_1276971 [Atractiella rhizophila]
MNEVSAGQRLQPNLPPPLLLLCPQSFVLLSHFPTPLRSSYSVNGALVSWILYSGSQTQT